ncbi:MFS transporter [Corynebacterium glyciniphilum]|uniref:MFS transporter n=1 Tax=Corynebacterium glyciniphilum TaxID=1404244 RepID=UPI003DA1B260
MSAGRIPWWTLVVFTLTGFLTQTTSLMTAGLLPAMAEDFEVTEGAAGSLTSVFAIAIVITILPVTRLSYRFTRRQVIVTTVIALVISNILVATAPVLPLALIGRFIGGAAHGILSSAIPSVVTRVVPAAQVPTALGVVLAGNSAGLAVGAPLSAVLSGALGWRGAFVVMAVTGIVLAIALVRVVPPIRLSRDSTATAWSSLRTPGVLRISVSWGLVLLGHYAVLTFIAPLFTALGGDVSQVGMPLVILGCAGIVGVLCAGRISNRILVGATAGAGALVGTGFLVLWAAPPMWMVFAMLILWGAGSAASLALNQRCVLAAGRSAPEMAMSVALLINQFGIALGATVGGVAIENIGARAVPATGAFALMGSLLLLVGFHRVLRSTRIAGLRRVPEDNTTQE